ncbi:MAG: DUF2148 domain-containing protein [Eubacterium sp.]|nr:DUF2148 domain-containing protein [Eubacterium sp.]
MIKAMNDAEKDAAFRVADSMCAAAHTAPKANGLDKIVTAIVSGEDIEILAKEMEIAGREYGLEFFIRDADNIRNSHCVVLIAAKASPSGVPHCGMCGFADCAEMSRADACCSFSATDLGIAIGSAVSLAADNRIDNRVMYSIGRSALRLKLFAENVKLCYGIPLSTKAKSNYFDRAPGSVLL